MASDAELLQADLQARTDALDVTRSMIVQAPAGSGKTELLIQRYLCLLSTVGEPEEVVAITFTRKAASEMQLRVLAALERSLQGESGEAAHEQATLSAARRVLDRDQELGWQLRQSPRRMRILTLDAFCASITRLLPVSSGLGGSLSTSADTDMKRLYREAAAATLDWLAGNDANAAAVSRVLEHLDNSVGDYVDYLASMLAKRDQWLGIIGIGSNANLDAVRTALEGTIEQQVCAQLRLLRDRMEHCGGAAERMLLRYAGENLQDRSGEVSPLIDLRQSGWPGADARDVAAWRAIATLVLKKDGKLRISVNVRDGFPPGDDGEKAAFIKWLKTLQDEPGLADMLATAKGLPDTRYRDEQWQVMLALFALLPLAVAELRHLFAGNAVTDHVEVALAASAALGSSDDPGELAMLLDYRVRHLLVDEMQDTSIGQYRMLEQLTAGWLPGDGRTLFCVGDPMQSVYRFRDAEVGQFVAARQGGIGDLALDSLVLRQNFRSGEHLVHWFNSTFANVFPARDDIVTGAVAYSPSVPVERHAGSGDIRVYPLIDAGQQQEALCSADVIATCLDEDRQGQVAVLVRSRTQLPQLLAELRQRRIAARAIEIDRLTDLPEIIELLALTRAFCHAGDRLAWLALLRAPWAGLCWDDIHKLVRNDTSSSLPELAADEERLKTLSATGCERLQSLLATVARYSVQHGVRSLRERVECAWLALGGAACLQLDEQLENVYRYLDVLEKLEEGGSLADVALLETQLDDERVSSLGDDATRVQVMTMHKAKGLEFDHVVLHGLGRTSGSSRKDVLAWLNVTTGDGGSSMIISPLGPRSDLENDPLHRFIEASARDSDQLELDRLLYVACTRAVRSLHLVGSVSSRAQGSELGKPVRSSLLHRLWPVVEKDFEAAFAALPSEQTAGEAESEATFAAPTAKRMLLAWQYDSLPPPPPVEHEKASLGEREVEYAWAGSAARHAGTIVHRWLQKMTEGRVQADKLPPQLEAVSKRWAASLGVPAAELDEVTDRVRQALQGVVEDARGRWLLTSAGHAELRLKGRFAGRAAGIAIDRVIIDDDVHWLVDYKTGSHEGGDLDSFLQQESDRYRPQLRRYRDIYRAYSDAQIRTALYFPLLQRFVEIDVD